MIGPLWRGSYLRCFCAEPLQNCQWRRRVQRALPWSLTGLALRPVLAQLLLRLLLRLLRLRDHAVRRCLKLAGGDARAADLAAEAEDEGAVELLPCESKISTSTASPKYINLFIKRFFIFYFFRFFHFV